MNKNEKKEISQILKSIKFSFLYYKAIKNICKEQAREREKEKILQWKEWNEKLVKNNVYELRHSIH